MDPSSFFLVPQNVAHKQYEALRLYFVEGQITHAVFGPTEGDEAVYAALGFTQGTWEIDFSASAGEQTTSRSTPSSVCATK